MSGTSSTKSEGNELVFVALGGAGEIGMNLNLYGYGPPGEERWIMLDLGVTFSDGWPPGVDVIMADPAFIAERADQLDGLILTHAHEDHLGAVPYLWDRFRCPIFATPFTAHILDRKLAEPGWEDQADVTVVPLQGKFTVGPFELELITLTHSIPEPNAVVIRSPLGTVLHTGDWKFDPDPVVGDVSDQAALRALGDEGVLAMVCDSTNVFAPGQSGSEGGILDSMTEVIAECPGRVAVACFATNVARLETIARAALETGRQVVLAGRSLWRIQAAARENGYLADVPPFLAEEDVDSLPDDKVLIVCTGSQGEPRAALARIAAGDHPRVSLGHGDWVIFSSREIPGNETAIARVQNDLVARGVRIVTSRDAFVHVSGHPNRDELTHMYQLVRPRIAVPVHGELRHLHEHARLARECQVEQAVVAPNGAMARLAPGPVKVVDHVPTGRLALVGGRLVPMDGNLIKERIRGVWHGVVTVTVVVDDGGLAEEPQITTLGISEDPEDDPVVAAAYEAAVNAVRALPPRKLAVDDEVREAVRLAVRRTFRGHLDMKPVTTVHLVRI
ncbi:MAG: MBL fold hydrolase [Rhodospirillales bacterium CG15_BIG_FIL_POST_REV_8_21_14_020_66_15]|nr:MAG: MBL fold hydrolase [Rhodospirillales bacterium CG15_BIG_FIL_POST_REV_8_21_14_020_66_15]